MVYISAPGKIILFGEHAVVYDKTGVSAAIGGRAYANCDLCEKGITINAQDYGLKEAASHDELIQFLQGVEKLRDTKDYAALKELTKNPLNPLKAVTAKAMQCANYLGGLNISVRSEIPKASGFGSGSAIFATIAGSILAACNKLDNKTVSNIAYLGDVMCHGTPSGIDNSTVTYGGYMRFRKSEGITPLEMKNELSIIIGDTGIAASTSETVGLVRKRRESEPHIINPILDEIDEVAKEAIGAIAKGNLKNIGDLMNKNHALLADLGVSHPKLDELVDASKKAGAYGAKLAGGGGGGIMYALYETAEDRDSIAQAIMGAGGKPIVTTIGGEGIKVHE